MKKSIPATRSIWHVIRAATVILLLAFGAYASGPGRMPAFSLPDLDGKTRSQSEFPGQVVVIDFWATWCAACKETVPKLAGLQEKYGKKGLTVIGISVDKGSAEKVRKAARKLGINYLVLHDKDDSLVKTFGFTGLPSLYVFGRSGDLVSALPGYLPEQEGALAEAAVRALDGKP